MFSIKSFYYAPLLAVLTLLLAGCPDSDDFTQGHVQVAQTQTRHGHDEEHDEEHDDEHDDGHDDGHDHEEEHGDAKVIEDAEGHSVELLSAYLVLDQIELLECTTAATWLKRSFDGMLGTANAMDGHNHGHDHGGGGNEVPDDQRNLNRPHVINLMNTDEALLVLGNLRIPLGNYCGLRVSLVPAQDDAFGLPEDLNLIGTGFYMHWHHDIDGEESAITVDSTGTSLPMTVSLNFPEALTVSTDHHVVLAVNYGHIFEDIDLSTVSEAELPALLLEGIEHALEIHDVGNGELD